MKHLYKFILFVVLVFSFSCEEEGFKYYCNECTDDEPLNATLNLKISREILSEIRVYVYAGDLEDGILLESFNYPQTEYTVALNKKYTFVAEYRMDATYMCINSVTPRVRYYEVLCNNPCYFVTDRVVDLRLKYYRKEK
jgi:hypothetical protein